MQKSKDMDTQWMRCVAAFFVVLIHAVDLSSRTGVFFSAVSRFSVPVFVLISGYYMLQKERSFLELAKRSGFLLLQLIFWSSVQFLVELVLGTRIWNGIADLVCTVLAGSGHFWYLYALIGLYLFTPILQVFTNHADKRTYGYALVLLFLLGSPLTIALRMERFSLLTVIVDNMKIPHVLGFIFLYLMGDWLRRYPPKRYLLWMIAGILGMTATILWTLRLPPARAAELSLSFFFPGNMLGAIGFFVAVKTLYRSTGSRFMMAVSACTPGIYLSHMIVLKCLHLWLWPSLLALPSWIASPVLTLAAYILSFLVSLLIQHIPIVEKTI